MHTAIKIDELAILKYKLSQLLQDDLFSKDHPTLSNECLKALLKIEKQIIEQEQEFVFHENKYEPAGDRV